MKQGQGRPKLVIATTLSLILGFFFLASLQNEELPEAIEIEVSGMPTIGNPHCKVQVIVFEEPKCIACKNFNESIYPQIKKEFIDTGKAKYTVVPVAFIAGSKKAAESMYCVYHQDKEYPNPELFLSYLDYIYSNQPDEEANWATKEALIGMAKGASPAIDIEKLDECMEMEQERINIIKNTKLAEKIMSENLSTPRVYVNGIKAKSNSFSDIKELIELCHKHKDQL
jgi:protein-disulfide isomerase